jgi:BirA family biotin operon repressor/biotin-[acetyl-CoA-carboxylase] ligase
MVSKKPFRNPSTREKRLKKLYLTSPESDLDIPDYIHLEELRTCPSTNNYINENLESLSPHTPVLVSADVQTGGKGREGRKWIPVGEGGIYISYLLDIVHRESLQFLSLAAGAAVAEAVSRTTGITVQLKWPNDIELSGRKAGGILIENKIHRDKILAVVGIGLNVNVGKEQLAGEIADTATSLSMATGQKFNMGELILRICEYLLFFQGKTEKMDYSPLLKKYLFHLKHNRGDRIGFKHSGKIISGTFLRINEKGGLVLEHRNGVEETFFSGEILGSV